MSPMDYSPAGWVNPGTPGLPQARCSNPRCIAEGVPPRLVVAMTLDAGGRCVLCARSPADEDGYQLGMALG